MIGREYKLVGLGLGLIEMAIKGDSEAREFLTIAAYYVMKKTIKKDKCLFESVKELEKGCDIKNGIKRFNRFNTTGNYEGINTLDNLFDAMIESKLYDERVLLHDLIKDYNLKIAVLDKQINLVNNKLNKMNKEVTNNIIEIK